MADLRARYEGWREARERVRLAHAAGHDDALDFAHADEEFLDVTSGDGLGALGERDARLRVAVQGAVVARSLRELAAGARARPEEVELRRELVAAHSQALGRLVTPTRAPSHRRSGRTRGRGLPWRARAARLDRWRRDIERALRLSLGRRLSAAACAPHSTSRSRACGSRSRPCRGSSSTTRRVRASARRRARSRRSCRPRSGS
jgi:hypothetical protein